MKTLVLKRISRSNVATHGVLILNNRPVCVTLEEPWRDNEKLKSCIPTGVYHCVKYNGTKHKNVFFVQDVPLRS